MERINYNTIKIFEFLDKLNPSNFGIFFSILLHLVILLFAVGLPNFFSSKEIYAPNIIPIEILNIDKTSNVKKSENDKESGKNISPKKTKFNSSENTEIVKQFQIDQNVKIINEKDTPIIEIKEKINPTLTEKENIEVQQKKVVQKDSKVETFKTNKIKPKLKPEKNILKPSLNSSDVQIEPKINKEIKVEKKDNISKIQKKPEKDFNIASMLKDLRNEKTNNNLEEEHLEEEKKQKNDDNNNESKVLSISEIDLLRQQLSSCWNAPAGAIINIGDKVTISAKVQQNMKVFENSVRIVDTNISKSNPFYGPITDSAMRTLLNPECTPLKLPKEKYNLWKNLTITFDYSIMKGY